MFISSGMACGRMNIMVSYADINAMAQTLRGCFGADSVLLFGSYARQEATDDSDVDILVVMPHEIADEGGLYLAMRKILASRWPMPLDLVIRSRDAVTKWHSVPYSLIHEAMKDGKVLYARKPV